MKDKKSVRAVKKLLSRLKFSRNITRTKIVDAYVDFLIRTEKHFKGTPEKDLISTIRHDFSNYTELCKELHKIDKSKDFHRKFRNKVNGIIKEKFGHLIRQKELNENLGGNWSNDYTPRYSKTKYRKQD